MKGEALLIKVPAPGFTSLLRAPREKKWRLCCWVFFFFYIVPQPGQKKSIITLELLKQLGIMPLTMGKRNLFPLTRKSLFLLLIIHLKIKPIRWNIYLICYIQKLKNVDLKPKTLNKCPWNSWVVCFVCFESLPYSHPLVLGAAVFLGPPQVVIASPIRTQSSCLFMQTFVNLNNDCTMLCLLYTIYWLSVVRIKFFML